MQRKATRHRYNKLKPKVTNHTFEFDAFENAYKTELSLFEREIVN